MRSEWAFTAMLLTGCAPCEQLVVERADGSVVQTFCVEQAVTADERRQGLSGHPPLLPDEGLRMVFPLEGEACITNAPVDFPIDIAFMNGAGEITRIDREVPAGDTESRCEPVVKDVLETAGGALSEVAAGDRIR